MDRWPCWWKNPACQKKRLSQESIGQFKLVDVTTSEITFAWNFNGELARRSLRGMADTTAPAAADSRAAAAGPAAPPAPKTALGLVPSPGSAQGAYRSQSDNTPDGTLLSGFRRSRYHAVQ